MNLKNAWKAVKNVVLYVPRKAWYYLGRFLNWVNG